MAKRKVIGTANGKGGDASAPAAGGDGNAGARARGDGDGTAGDAAAGSSRAVSDPPRGSYITRADALKLLEIKPATLYTYVSRGLIRRAATAGRKQSFYYREDIERIRARGSARAPDAALAAGAIRYGEPIVPTAITELTDEGPRYRSRNATDLARAGISFEAVSELLWTGMLLPSQPPWRLQPPSDALARFVRDPRGLSNPMTIHDAMLLVTLAAAIDSGHPQIRVADTASPAATARQLILLLTGCFGYLSAQHRYRAPKPDESVAHAIAASLGIAATPQAVRTIDVALVLCADHELNPATFVARIAASSEGDLYACIASAISTHSGARIGRAIDRLDAFFRGPVTLESLVPGSANAFRDAEIATLGFNHPLYPRGDPRAACLLQAIRALPLRGKRVGTILGYLDEAQERHKQLPRIETAIALLSLALSMPVGAASGIVTLARIGGWVAHIAEQRLAGFLIRPRAKFVA